MVYGGLISGAQDIVLRRSVSRINKMFIFVFDCFFTADDWEVPFEDIRSLQWLGSGAQGAVFLGNLKGEEIAVKKVRDEKETDIKHLRKLNHPNIVSIKLVSVTVPHVV